jgi:hypothetical protein
MLCHGTTLKGLTAGVPLVCLPMGRDQDDTAARGVSRRRGTTEADRVCENHPRRSGARTRHEVIPGERRAARLLAARGRGMRGSCRTARAAPIASWRARPRVTPSGAVAHFGPESRSVDHARTFLFPGGAVENAGTVTPSTLRTCDISWDMGQAPGLQRGASVCPRTGLAENGHYRPLALIDYSDRKLPVFLLVFLPRDRRSYTQETEQREQGAS